MVLLHVAVVTGAVVSTWTSWVCIVSALPAVSTENHFTVVLAESVIGLLKTALFVVGVLPFVV